MKKVFLVKAIAVMACLMSSIGAMAQEAYANYTPADSTLTFYCDAQRSSRPGFTYSLNTGDDFPDWIKNRGTDRIILCHAVIDPSFAAARPTSTHGWFYSYMGPSSITGIEYLNTSSVTDMGYMFSGCS